MKKLAIKDGLAGKGLFATVSLSKGARVAEYKGKKIPNTIADTLATRFLFDLENGWSIDGDAPWNIARYVNHACDPNCEAELKGERIVFYALRDIAKGEELTIDYGPEYFNEFIKPFGCLCSHCKFPEKRQLRGAEKVAK